MKFSVLFLLLTPMAFADGTPPAGQFEVIDVSGQVTGDLKDSSQSARKNWHDACDEWKKETMGLNKNNEVLGINCNNPSCNLIDAAKWQCTSTGTYKVKTAGVRVNTQTVAPPLPEPPVPAALPPEHEIAMAPPEVIVEAEPPPRVGFLWMPGYWGWSGRRHVWIPGRWGNERPGYYWNRERWTHRGMGWHFEPGRWEVRH